MSSLYINGYCTTQSEQDLCTAYLYGLLNVFECGYVGCFYNTNQINYYNEYGNIVYVQKCALVNPTDNRLDSCITGEWTP